MLKRDVDPLNSQGDGGPVVVPDLMSRATRFVSCYEEVAIRRTELNAGHRELVTARACLEKRK
jgi:alkylhydroperoxidase/carboxymuconolactone decarboxylase family protein YurZ